MKLNFKKKIEKELKLPLAKISLKNLKEISKEYYDLQKAEGFGIVGMSLKMDLQALGNELYKRGFTVKEINNIFRGKIK